jgi:hypothetical protein
MSSIITPKEKRMSGPFRYSFTNYFDLKQIERSSSSWDDKQAAKRELKRRELKARE